MWRAAGHSQLGCAKAQLCQHTICCILGASWLVSAQGSVAKCSSQQQNHLCPKTQQTVLRPEWPPKLHVTAHHFMLRLLLLLLHQSMAAFLCSKLRCCTRRPSPETSIDLFSLAAFSIKRGLLLLWCCLLNGSPMQQDCKHAKAQPTTPRPQR